MAPAAFISLLLLAGTVTAKHDTTLLQPVDQSTHAVTTVLDGDVYASTPVLFVFQVD